MKRSLLALLLLCLAALNASAQRAPLRPLVLAQAPIPTLPASVLPLSVPPAAAASGFVPPPKVIDSLRAHAPEATLLPSVESLSGAAAGAESLFLRAASLGDGPGVLPSAAEPASAADERPLSARLRELVALDDRGSAEEKAALEKAFERMLETPTGRRYAEEFLAEGAPATVRFIEVPNSRLFFVDGRKVFDAAQAYTLWHREEGRAEIFLNRHYLEGDPDFLRESLPSILGHELLGHGLWYARAEKAGHYTAFHHHELNEALARMVGWAIDHELDGRFEDVGAYDYASDPAGYLLYMKTRMPYYASTYSSHDMEDPIAALRGRMAQASEAVARAKRNLENQANWPGAVDHFVRAHGVPERRFRLLRRQLADAKTRYEHEVANAKAVEETVAIILKQVEDEPGQASAEYLKAAVREPFIGRLEAERSRLDAVLRGMARGPIPAPRPAPWPKGQISWAQFLEMYDADRAEDERREHKHWRPVSGSS